MALPDLTKIRRFRGRIVANPTNLSVAFPHGGTALGLTRTGEFRFNPQIGWITAEEYGNKKVDGVFAGEDVLFAAVMRNFDADMINTVFPNTVAGSGGTRVIRHRKTDRGLLLAKNAVKLLFAPLATDDHEHILIYRAIPFVELAAKLQLSANVEGSVAVAFYGTIDDSDRVYDIGRKADLTL